MVFTYNHVTTSTGATTSFTFSGEAIGAEASDRIIVIGITARKNGTGARSLSSATIGGITATKHVELQNSGDNSGYTAWISAAVPSGTTATIILNFSASMFRCSIGVYVTTGMNATPTDTDSTVTDNSALNLSYVDGGVVVGVATSIANAAAAAWTNLTEKYDASMSGDTTYSGAQSAAQSGSGTLACTCDFTTATTPSFAYASFEPAAVGSAVQQSLMLMGVGN